MILSVLLSAPGVNMIGASALWTGRTSRRGKHIRTHKKSVLTRKEIQFLYYYFFLHNLHTDLSSLFLLGTNGTNCLRHPFIFFDGFPSGHDPEQLLLLVYPPFRSWNSSCLFSLTKLPLLLSNWTQREQSRSTWILPITLVFSGKEHTLCCLSHQYENTPCLPFLKNWLDYLFLM